MTKGKNMKQKLTSRKFLTAISGIITGIFLILMGDTTEGTTTVVSSIVAYLVAEGIVDSKKIQIENYTNREIEDTVEDSIIM